jgi:tRNA(Ile)-lysidine synthase
MQPIDRVRRTIRRHELAAPGTRVVVALSGGSDSVALAHILSALHDAGELRVAGVAHFNHRLRASADRDERFCEQIAASLRRAIVLDGEDVAARARRDRQSIEHAAHVARHAFFERARRHFEADVVALGHTRDDQAETFLMRLVRGAGPRGLAAMHPRRGAIVRPLLDCRRAELRAYLAGRGIPFVEDESNADLHIARNRVRATLIPFIEQQFNRSIVDVLADEADLAREDWLWMGGEADAAARAIARRSSNGWRLESEGLRRLPVALRRLLLWRALTDVAGGRPIAFSHVQAAMETLENGRAVHLPGQLVERIGREVVLTKRPGPGDQAANLFHYPLSIPGEARVPEAGVVVTSERAGSAAEAGFGAIPRNGAMASMAAGMAIVRLDRCEGPLAVRNRRPGDAFKPLGLGGRKKLQDFFVDRKVLKRQRDLVPIVVDRSDRIVWVAGHAIADEFRVTEPAQAVIILRLKQVQWPGGEAVS